jgi:hypothetical protein
LEALQNGKETNVLAHAEKEEKWRPLSCMQWRFILW